MTQPSDVTMVIVHFRDPVAVRALIESTGSWTRRPDRTVVVDNSGDLTASDLPDGVVITDPGGNDGYGTAVNHAYRSALGSPDSGFLLVCTQDVQLEPDALEILVDVLGSDPAAGIAAPALAYRSAPDTIFSLGGTLSARSVPTLIATGEPMAAAAEHPERETVDWSDGAVLLVRNRVMRELDGFAPEYFLYVEEIDFAFRARLAGWTTVVDRRARGRQEPGNYRTYLRYRNSVHFSRKFRKHIGAWPWLFFLAEDTARMLLRRHRFTPLQACLGIVHGLSGRMVAPRWAARR